MTDLSPDLLTGPALLALKDLDEKAFLARVLKVYRACKGYRRAAEELKIGQRTMIRLINKYPELQGGTMTNEERAALDEKVLKLIQEGAGQFREVSAQLQSASISSRDLDRSLQRLRKGGKIVLSGKPRRWAANGTASGDCLAEK